MGTQVNEISIRYKQRIPAPFWKQIKCSKDAAELLFQTWNKDTIEVHESFKIVLLNNSNKVKGIYQISQGGITATLVDLRILFAVVLKTLSVGVILSHSHPSGKLEASDHDRRITDKIKKAAELFDVKILDHIIIAPTGEYYSFADNGQL
ncbi:JAB domain-containing protein [Flagellimonas sp. S3867]|uniref:JAB domain-containing protein n=1 Tax=Flagellimonas sp. S3867 TaxID=2768063 RepID=UPI0016874746|nr:JAB domain-containing protein [Flagellimonas sp. S3867]